MKKNRLNIIIENKEIVANHFVGSLDVLGINYRKRTNLPFEQLRLSLINSIRQVVDENRTVLQVKYGISGFAGKKIQDFGREQIEAHRQLLHSYIALLYLGDASYIRPLIHYFEFPEQRWNVHINFVLELLTKPEPRIEFKIPTHRIIIGWQKWMVLQPPWVKIYDISRVILTSFLKSKSRSPQEGDSFQQLPGSSSQLYHTPKHAVEYYDLDKTCRIYKELSTYRKKEDLSGAFEWLEQNVNLNSEPFEFNTILAPVRDFCEDLSKRRDVYDLAGIISKSNLKPSTSVIIFQAFFPGKNTRSIASPFIKTVLRSSTIRKGNLSALIDVFTNNKENKSMQRISHLLRNYNAVDNEIKWTVKDLKPFIDDSIRSWLIHSSYAELSSLTLIDQHEKKNKLQLFNAFKTRFHINQEVVQGFSHIGPVSYFHYKEFPAKVKVLFHTRESFEREMLHRTKPLNGNLWKDYATLFRRWVWETSKSFVPTENSKEEAEDSTSSLRQIAG